MGTPHKHAAVIKAWADGASIQYKSIHGRWLDVLAPTWQETNIYRIKREPREYWVVPKHPKWHSAYAFSDVKDAQEFVRYFEEDVQMIIHVKEAVL